MMRSTLRWRRPDLNALTLLVLGLIAVLRASATLLAQEPPHAHAAADHQLGTVVFPNSGAPGAQEPFLRGLALLHSFEYPDAAEAFREAQAADPAFALAYWGEALTNTQLLWGVDDTASARAALARLASTAEARLERAGGPREMAYGAAVEAFYAQAEVATRARAFADSLRHLADREPDDHEAASFASLAIQMALSVRAFPPEQETTLREEAVRLAERVFGANPEHPGAAHYLIHAYDDPVLAPDGLEAARAYARIAPDAPHAVHMPSHIFVQVGLWADAAASNERAWAASRAWAARRGESAAELDFHSLEWLQYAYLQQGRYREAEALGDSARAGLASVDLSASAFPDARHVVSRMQFSYAAETGDWDAWRAPELADTAVPASQRARAFAVYGAYQAAAGAAMKGDSTLAKATAERFRAESAPGGSGSLPSPWMTLAAAQLEALAAQARGDRDAALAGLAEAVTAERELRPLGPPSYLPPQELLGAALLEAGRPREAAEAFEESLARRPDRSAALLGLARARAANGDEAGAARAYGELMENWRDADPDLAALPEARRGSGADE